jgi:hypothetical protein
MSLELLRGRSRIYLPFFSSLAIGTLKN